MATCPTCRSQHPDTEQRCPHDGTTLVPDEAISGLDADLAPGHVVGEYRIEGKLGEGGFGAVYRAIHPVIGKAAAIKVLNHQYSANPQMVARFIAEARAVNQIRHKGIIDIFSFGRLEDGRQYYIMELLEGVTLDAYVKQRGRLPLEEALPILRQVARALDAAHGAGIAHRDLKPENVFLAFDDDDLISTKLLDFGIAKLLGDSAAGQRTRTGAVMGSPMYMSPEQARGRNIDHRTDVYSFGVMAYELLAGRIPFEGADVMDLLFQHVNAPPPALSSLCPELGPALDAVAKSMIAKEPADRPQSVGAAVDALIAAAQAAGKSVPPVAKRSSVVLPVTRGDAGGAPGAGEGTTGRSSGRTAMADTQEAPGNSSAPAARTMLAGEAMDQRPSAGRRPATLVAIAALALGVGGALAYSIAAEPKADETVAALPPEPPAPPPVPPTLSAVAPPEPTTGAEVSPAPVPAEVVITVKATPPEVDVLMGGKPIGKTPTVRLPRGEQEVELTFVARGYRSETRKVTPAADEELQVSLVKEVAAPPPTVKKGGGGVHQDLQFE